MKTNKGEGYRERRKIGKRKEEEENKGVETKD